MSLFQAREWWSTKLGDDEEFDRGSMALGNVDNNMDGSVKVVTGSLQGMLRVHHPVKADFRIEDLLLEEDLGAPILQVSIGRFIPAAPRLKAIAVLHPRKLGVYTVEGIGGKGGKASYYELFKAYEHVFGVEGGGHFTSYNMTHGGFGGVPRDLLCVQSMDGRLQVFEQDAHAFTRRLNGILAPGPVCYVAKIDAFVVGNSEMGVDCYKYQALAASQEDREEGKNEGISGARGLQAYWSCRLGEPALDIFVAKFSRALGPGCVDIVVVGERTLFTLREQGTVRLQKMLGYQPACSCKYVVVAAPGEHGAGLTGTTVHEIDDGFSAIVEEENIILGADTGQLLVYKDLQLVWQASLDRPPVNLAVAKFGEMPGIVCSLDDNGMLCAWYQGTDPPTSSVLATETKEMDYEQINREHRQLLQVIRRSQTGSARPPTGKLTLQVQIPRFIDDARPQKQQAREEYGGGGLAYDEDSQEASQPAPKSGCQQSGPVKITVRFVITYSGANEIRDATLNMSLPPGISAEPSSALLPPLRGIGSGGGGRGSKPSGLDERGGENEPLVVTVLLTAERGAGFLPSSLVGKASVVYTRSGASDGGSEPMSARCELRLPLALVARVVETTRSGAHKFTFSTNQPPVPLSSLFEDISSAGADGESSLDHSWGEGLHSNGAGGGPAGVGRGGGVGAMDASGVTDLTATDNTSMSLRYWTVGPDAKATKDVSIAVSKNSGRYRVQSESLPAACLISTEVVRRLKEYFGEHAERDRSGGSSANGEKSSRAEDHRLQIEYTEALPLREFYEIIDEHFQRRQDLERFSESLNRAAHQYRVVEKRLLSRFRDRNPSPLDKLDVVSEETYTRLVQLGEQVENAQKRLDISAKDLGCAAGLVAMLARYRFQLSSKDHTLLLAHLFPNVTDTDDQGWEESVDAAMVHLLRTSLAKVAKDSVPAGSLGQAPLTMPADTVKLKKHISIVCDRLSKGARLALRPAAPPGSPRLPPSTAPSMPPLFSPHASPSRSGRG